MVAVPAAKQVAADVVIVGMAGDDSFAAMLNVALVAAQPLPFVAVTV